MRRPWQSNTAWAACSGLGWSTSPGLEVVFGLLRAGKQFSDEKHHFSSWGQPKRSGVCSEPSPVSPEPHCLLADLRLLLQWGHSRTQASQEFQGSRRCPSLSSGSFLFIRSHQASAALTREPAPPGQFEVAQIAAVSCCVRLNSPPPVSTSNASQLTLRETSQNPSYPRSSPRRTRLANGKQLQSLMLSQGIRVLAVKVPGSDPVDRL